jgi:hypothetical protein
MLSFWLAIHLQKLDEARCLYDLDPLMGKVVSNLLSYGGKLLSKKRERNRARISKSMFSANKSHREPEVAEDSVDG